MSDSCNSSEIDPAESLRRWQRGDADGFRALVKRYHPLVYAAALRRTGGRHALAEDAAQTVFVDLVRRAPGLTADGRLGGWLYQRAVRAAGDLMKSEQRRKRREAAAAVPLMAPETPASSCLSASLALHLDAALLRLSTPERDAVVLRCMEGLDYRSVGAALRINEDTAQKRVTRALEKLRKLLARRGFAAAGAALAAGLQADSAQAAALPGLTARAEEVALTASAQAATPAVWSMYLKAGAAGTALAGVIWTWPLIKAYRASAAATPPPAPVMSQTVAADTTRRLPVFASIARAPEGLSVAEIVARIAALAPSPQSELLTRRFTELARQLTGRRTGEALRLMAASLAPHVLEQIDTHQWRRPLLESWGRVELLAALQYAWAQMPDHSSAPAFESMRESMNTILASEDCAISPQVRDWLEALVLEAGVSPRSPKRDFFHIFANNTLVKNAVQSGSLESLSCIISLERQSGLPLFAGAENFATSEEQLRAIFDAVPLLDSPKQRALVAFSTLKRLGMFNRSRAKEIVASTEHLALRMQYAAAVAAPGQDALSRKSPDPQNDYRALADWWLSNAPPEQRQPAVFRIARHWLDLDPRWALEWLHRQEPPSEAVTEWLREAITSNSVYLSHGNQESVSRSLPLLKEALEIVDPGGASPWFDTLIQQAGEGGWRERLQKILKP